MEKKRASSRTEPDLDSILIDEITMRLPTAELAKIIRGALDFGRNNRPFTQLDLVRAMAFGMPAVQRPERRS